MLDDFKYPVKGATFFILAIAIPLCTFMEALDISISNVAIPYIAGDLGVSSNQGTWVITFFMVGNAIVLPISGWLSEKIGPIRLILISCVTFGLFSFLCGMALSFTNLVIFRFLQGLAAGPFMPLGQILLTRIFPKGKEQMALALWAMVLLVGPIMGPVVGGWITENYTWRWIFFINVPVAAFAFLGILMNLRPFITKVGDQKLDLVGLIFLSIGITCLQIFVDKGRQLDWFHSNLIRLLFCVGIICVAFLVAYEWSLKEPLIEVKLFKIPSFLLGSWLLALSFMAMYASLIITPLWMEDFMGYTALKAGICLGAMGVLPFFFAPVLGKLMETGRYKLLMAISLIILSLVSYYYTTFNTQVSYQKIMGSRFLFGLGLSFYIAPATALPLVKVPAAKLTNAACILQFLRLYLAGFGTSIYTTIWSNRATFHHEILSSELTPFSDSLIQMKELIIQGIGYTKEQYLALLNQIVDQQAYMIATNDVMLMSSLAFLALLIVLYFIRLTPKECQQRKSSS